jgi:hypothetical protein
MIRWLVLAIAAVALAFAGTHFYHEHTAREAARLAEVRHAASIEFVTPLIQESTARMTKAAETLDGQGRIADAEALRRIDEDIARIDDALIALRSHGTQHEPAHVAFALKYLTDVQELERRLAAHLRANLEASAAKEAATTAKADASKIPLPERVPYSDIAFARAEQADESRLASARTDQQLKIAIAALIDTASNAPPDVPRTLIALPPVLRAARTP